MDEGMSAGDDSIVSDRNVGFDADILLPMSYSTCHSIS